MTLSYLSRLLHCIALCFFNSSYTDLPFVLWTWHVSFCFLSPFSCYILLLKWHFSPLFLAYFNSHLSFVQSSLLERRLLWWRWLPIWSFHNIMYLSLAVLIRVSFLHFTCIYVHIWLILLVGWKPKEADATCLLFAYHCIPKILLATQKKMNKCVLNEWMDCG